MKNQQLFDYIVKIFVCQEFLIFICKCSYSSDGNEDACQLRVGGFSQIHRVMLMFEEVDSMNGMKSVEDVVRRERPTGKYVIEWGAVLA